MKLFDGFLEDVAKLAICLNSAQVPPDNGQWWEIHVLVSQHIFVHLWRLCVQKYTEKNPRSGKLGNVLVSIGLEFEALLYHQLLYFWNPQKIHGLGQ